ncbi:MAG: TadE/TadG family type IV pilus assembly protein [Planctomycetaceae bacterium]
MMKNNRAARRGNILLLSASLLPVLLGLAAFTIDMGYMILANSQLSNTADAAALAGVSGLLPLQTLAVGETTAPDQATQVPYINTARTRAAAFAALNKAGGTSITIPDARLTADILVGYQANPGDTVSTTSPNLPNAVAVTVRRDTQANGPISLFFAPVLGVPTYSTTATATAAFKPLTVTSFKSTPGLRAKLLPVAVAANLWRDLMTNGVSPDGASHDTYTVRLPTNSITPPNNVTTAPDNVPEFTDAYGDKTSPGNFGLVSLGHPASSDPTFSDWITKGPDSTDIQYLLDNNLLPITPNKSGEFPAWDAGPGLKSNLVTDLNDIIGQPRIVPLYNTYSGQGTGATYNIVGFAGVTVVQATDRGNNIQITLQPIPVTDPTAIATPTAGEGTAQINASSLVYRLSITN